MTAPAVAAARDAARRGDGARHGPAAGDRHPAGRGGPPLLCNVYLHRLDRAWRGAYGTLVRYADDAVVMCRSRGQAEAALARLTVLLADLGLEPKAAKTRIVHLSEGGEGVDFLGFHHRLVRSRAVPGRAGGHLPGPLALTQGDAARPGPDPVHDDAVPAGCYRSSRSCGSSTGSCAAGPGTSATGTPPTPSTRSGSYALMRLALFIAKRHQRGRAWGFAQVYRSGERTRAGQPQWHRRRTQAQPGLAGYGRTPPVKDVGEPCAGEPHARFDGRGLETERYGVTAPVPDPTNLYCRGLYLARR